eukprot:CAMPEP_0182443508 /NCGR_PEP_ID=MMETSP1172-20130603/2228_1 /TAXON_ID=708627 /ORGANISM="Timspurckia oligopyrenoides, Strain CCMP3278" /LENGTH=520 /DNA_ID=CAMNT_0024638815 /DNA_START=169 /DNA_END=1731 /DNA_ORIENTATION=+
MSSLVRELSYSSNGLQRMRQRYALNGKEHEDGVFAMDQLSRSESMFMDAASEDTFSRTGSYARPPMLTIPPSALQNNPFSSRSNSELFMEGYMTPNAISQQYVSTPKCPSPPEPVRKRTRAFGGALSDLNNSGSSFYNFPGDESSNPGIFHRNSGFKKNAAAALILAPSDTNGKFKYEAAPPTRRKQASSSETCTTSTDGRLLRAINRFLPKPNSPSRFSKNGQKRSIGSFLEKTQEASRYLTEFEEIGVIGGGDKGVVFRARNHVDGCDYAIKSGRKALRGAAELQLALGEVHALAALPAHPNVARYFTSWLENDRSQLYIQLELCGASVALGSEACPKAGDEMRLIRIALHVARALRHIHANEMAHMDVKPDNVLIGNQKDASEPAVFKLVDFGLCCRSDGSDYSGREGDCRYLAPELLDDMCVSEVQGRCCSIDMRVADMFSFGAMLMELYLQEPLPAHGSGWHELRNASREHLHESLARIASPPLIEITAACLSEPSSRPNAAQVCQLLESNFNFE